MGEMAEFSLVTRTFLRAYRWRKIAPVPWAPLAKPLSDCRLALVSSAGFVTPGQSVFDESVRGGDSSFRSIPSDFPVADLIDTHRSDSFDHKGMVRDPNLAFPIDRVRELVESGRIHSVGQEHISFMGSITAPRRLIRDTAPEIARRLLESQVDVALLVPV
jgi:D-proline reductase (dithiol) PrdB